MTSSSSSNDKNTIYSDFPLRKMKEKLVEDTKFPDNKFLKITNSTLGRKDVENRETNRRTMKLPRLGFEHLIRNRTTFKQGLIRNPSPAKNMFVAMKDRSIYIYLLQTAFSALRRKIMNIVDENKYGQYFDADGPRNSLNNF